MQYHGLTHLILTSLTLGVIILATIVGNIFVIAAIALERNLHHIGNYLIASLAVADLMVATLVMPLAAVNEVTTRWFLGPIVCDIWISFDVLCCTSSILHLVAISLDRYWAVNRADYIHNRSARRICGLIALSWGLSAVISIPPLFTGERPEARQSYNQTLPGGVCMISQNWGYTVFSTLGAFYIPLIFMIIIYLSVFRTARARIRKRQFAKGRNGPTTTSAGITTASEEKTKDGNEDDEHSLRGTEEEKNPIAQDNRARRADFADEKLSIPTACTDQFKETGIEIEVDDCSSSSTLARRTAPDIQLRQAPIGETGSMAVHTTSDIQIPQGPTGSHNGYSRRVVLSALPAAETRSAESTLGVGASLATPNSLRGSWLDLTKLHWDHKTTVEKSPELKAKEKREQKRERKAARTLAIITGSFITCWLPFFILALVRPFCGERCRYPPLLTSVIGWLGFFNSFLNPIIYTVFNPDFRQAFQKILFGKYRRR